MDWSRVRIWLIQTETIMTFLAKHPSKHTSLIFQQFTSTSTTFSLVASMLRVVRPECVCFVLRSLVFLSSYNKVMLVARPLMCMCESCYFITQSMFVLFIFFSIFYSIAKPCRQRDKVQHLSYDTNFHAPKLAEFSQDWKFHFRRNLIFLHENFSVISRV